MWQYLRSIRKWLTPGLSIKRWFLLLLFGVAVLGITIAQSLVELYRQETPSALINLITFGFVPPVFRIIIGMIVGIGAVGIGILSLNKSILAPFAAQQRGSLVDLVYDHSRRQKGSKVVAIGGGTGLPSVLRGLKEETSNLTAIVTVADDGGSSGKLRRELGVLPPGDLRNNIAALADDEDLMTQLFQYRFTEGGLEGHSFGNLFLTALSSITGSMDRALVEAGRVLAIKGNVLPSTLQDVRLAAEIRKADGSGLQRVEGESQIPLVEGKIERVSLMPDNVRAFPDSIRAILRADLLVVGPGSLYTSILPNLLVKDVYRAIRASPALVVYVCNIATQKGETDDFSVVDHIAAIERHTGPNLFQVILANNCYPMVNAGPNTVYVSPIPPDHDIRKRYEIYETDLTDTKYPWRHDAKKLRHAIQNIMARHGASDVSKSPQEG